MTFFGRRFNYSAAGGCVDTTSVYDTANSIKPYKEVCGRGVCVCELDWHSYAALCAHIPAAMIVIMRYRLHHFLDRFFSRSATQRRRAYMRHKCEHTCPSRVGHFDYAIGFVRSTTVSLGVFQSLAPLRPKTGCRACAIGSSFTYSAALWMLLPIMIYARIRILGEMCRTARRVRL